MSSNTGRAHGGAVIPASGPALTPRDLATGARRVAATLSGLGIGPQARVALCAQNSAGFAWTLLGLLAFGSGIVLVDPGLPGSRVAEIADEADAGLLVIDDDRHASSCLARGLPRERVVTVAALVSGESPEDGSRLCFDRWSAREDGLISWSSGSTGQPKAIVRSGGSIMANVARSASRMDYTGSDVLAPLLPYSHQYGMSLILLAATARTSLLIAPAGRLDRALASVAAEGATVVDATPATYRSVVNFLARRPGLAGALGRVRMWCSGGAPLPDDLRRAFAAATGRLLLDGYGSTELGNVALAGPREPSACPPLDGVRAWVSGPDGGELPAGQVGEVWVDSPDLMRGTLEHGVLRSVPPGPFRTGDIGLVDERGSLRVVGREGAVHRRGYTLYPDYLAHRAEELGYAVRVVPLEHSTDDCRLVFVVEDPAMRGIESWRRRFGEVLARHEGPDRVLVVRRLPRLANGKPDNARIAEIVRSETAQRRNRPRAQHGAGTSVEPEGMRA
ncbi:class I adenylate-forming enzyme family protein [Amycolatopsis sp. NPDC059657]|uniref:class I adenylate-forming enzyme family protein n=1 Tax=Amycolatopsis sp. NPDC059657 TaxID=3346899 RepID=UPI003671DE2A